MKSARHHPQLHRLGNVLGQGFAQAHAQDFPAQGLVQGAVAGTPVEAHPGDAAVGVEPELGDDLVVLALQGLGPLQFILQPAGDEPGEPGGAVAATAQARRMPAESQTLGESFGIPGTPPTSSSESRR